MIQIGPVHIKDKQRDDVVRLIDAMLEWYSDETKWYQGHFGITKDNVAIRYEGQIEALVGEGETPKCLCVEGAALYCVARLNLSRTMGWLHVVRGVAEWLGLMERAAYYWNDQPERRFEDVVGMLKGVRSSLLEAKEALEV